MMPMGKRTVQFYRRLERGHIMRYTRKSLLYLLVYLLLLTFVAGCCFLRPYKTPTDVDQWQDTEPPQLSLKEKERTYQQRLESRYQMPDGLIRYRRLLEGYPELPGYGDLSDGCFFLGIYLASQALRFATTGSPEAREQVLLSLSAMKLYAEVSGEHGLLARYFSPVKPDDERWLKSPQHPEYFWRSDVSRDQYAGYIHGLGVTWAVVSDPEIRSQIAPLAAALADHLIKNDLEIIDWDGKRTTHGDLRGRIFGFLPNGVNALICLAIAKVAAESTGEQKYIDFYERLVGDGYPRITYWAHFSVFGIGNRVNDHMGYLALYPLLLLEDDQDVVRELRKSARRSWSHVGEDRNAFFSFVHAALVGDVDEAKRKGREAIFEFPDNKVIWPVDLTREGFDFPRAFLNTRKCEPRSKRAIPVYLRPHSSSLWVSDPYRLAAYLESKGDGENTGIDYLVAYWLGRYHGFIGADE